MITGILGNALGYDHSDFYELQRLQERLRYASRQDRAGQEIQDYQTVDLSQDFMRDKNGWTTQGWLDERKGGAASRGTHIRLRDYRADAIHTVALTLEPAEEQPTIEELEDALQHPERPLFIGRKTCLPSTPLLIDKIQVKNLTKALKKTKLPKEADQRERYPAWWPVDKEQDHPKAEIEKPVTDKRDWSNQIHVGERWIAHGEIEIET
jgi:CRISPR system Cascade subunit CasD